MITEENFAALAQLRDEANRLRLACISRAGPGATLHLAYDAALNQTTSVAESSLLNALQMVPSRRLPRAAK